MNAIMSSEKTKHYPVMLNQILSILSPQHGGTFIDCTFGGGGYSKAILKFPNTKVIALDRDTLTKNHADILIKKYPNRFQFINSKFSEISKLKQNPKAIIFDLGLSSMQLSDNTRGFSFNSKKSINMEMGINNTSTIDVINKLDRKKLGHIIKIFGDEKDGKKIANKIDNYRRKNKIETSEQLAEIIKKVKKKHKSYKTNPATKTFQAIRIFVNKEMSELVSALIAATNLLKNGGILLVVSFHSLEDKIVKNFFNIYSNLGKNPSRYIPFKDKRITLFNLTSKKPQIPSEKEILINKRSRSAKLRYAIKNQNSVFDPNEFLKKFENYFEIEKLKI